MTHDTIDVLASSPKWYTRLPASSLTCLLPESHRIHDPRPSPQTNLSPKSPARMNRKRYIDHYSKMSYHLRKRGCDQLSNMEADKEIQPARHIKRIAQQRNRAFHLDSYQELRRGFVKKAVQAKHESDEQPTIHDVLPNQRMSQRCNPRRSGIRTRRRGNKNEDLGLGFVIPAKYQFFSIDVDSEDADFYPPEWFPNMDHVVDQVILQLEIDNRETSEKWIDDPYLPRLHPNDKALAAYLALPASKYLRCKRTLIMAACEFNKHGVQHVRCVDTRKLLHVDSSKSTLMHQVFQKLGWLQPRSPST